MSKQTDEPRAIPLRIIDAAAPAPDRPPVRHSKAHEQLMRSHVHYVGFRITDEGREYTLRATNEAPRLFVFLITHQQFQLGRARYQDAPDLCCAKLTRVLMEDAAADHDSPVVLTAAELADYRVGRADPSARRRRDRRSDTQARN
jgi:hypothetical protein